MPASIYFRVGEKDEITLDEFLSAGRDFLKLLRELDAAVSHDPAGSVRWTVSFLSKNSPAEIGVTAKRRPSREDRSAEIGRAAIVGSLALKDRGERPAEYSDAALAVLQRIADKSTKLGPSLIYTKDNGRVDRQESRIDIGTAQRVQEFTAPRSRSWGTLIGRLDTITVRKGTEFRIIDEETKSPVRCRFHQENLERVKELLGQRVIASGIIHANSAGSPLRLEVEGDIDTVEAQELPTIDQMVGLAPDLMGGLTLLEFLEDEDADDESDLLGQ
jgi:hypothetical protein